MATVVTTPVSTPAPAEAAAPAAEAPAETAAPAAEAPKEAAPEKVEATEVTEAPAEGEASAEGGEQPEGEQTAAPSAEEVEAKALAERTEKREKARLQRAENRRLQKEREEALAAKEREVAALAKAKESGDLIEIAKAAGWSDDQILDYMAKQAGDEPSEADQLREELKALKARLDGRETQEKTAAEEAEMAARRERIEKGRAGVIEEIKKGGDKYEAINASGRQSLVIAVAEEYVREHKTALNFDTAVNATEDFLIDLTSKVAATKKFKAKNAPPPAAKSPAKDGKSLGASAGAKVPSLENFDDVIDPRERLRLINERDFNKRS